MAKPDAQTVAQMAATIELTRRETDKALALREKAGRVQRTEPEEVDRG